MDKMMTNYQQDILYYVVVDDDNDIYMKFLDHIEALEYYDLMKEMYFGTNKKLFFTKVKHTVLLEDDLNNA